MYTKFLPCESCDDMIRNLVMSARGTTVFIGYTDLYMNRGVVNSDLEYYAQQRRDSLETFLRNNFRKVVPDFLWRSLPTTGLTLYRGHRERRHTCQATKNREFIITMDFTTGKASVQFYDIRAADSWWAYMGLYSQNTYLTYQYTNMKTNGRLVFDYYLSDKLEVRYFTGYYTNTVALKSFRWKQWCFDWVKLNKIPGQPELKIKIDVSFRPRGYNPNSYDFVAIQTINQIDSHKSYWNWQWVSKFNSKSNERW